jgi:hypothetical protein
VPRHRSVAYLCVMYCPGADRSIDAHHRHRSMQLTHSCMHAWIAFPLSKLFIVSPFNFSEMLAHHYIAY